jgi:hypothetical protein
VSRIKTAILSFIASELFILAIELTFGVPLNVYYYMDLNLTKSTDITSPLFLSNGVQAESGNLMIMESLLSLSLWFLTSPALLIAVVVYILAPEDESITGQVSHT